MIIMKKSNVGYIVVLTFSILLFISISFLAAFGFDYKLIIGSIVYFIITFLSLKYMLPFRPIILVQLITLPVFLALILFNMLDFKATWISAPSNIFLLISSYVAYCFFKLKNYLFPILLCALIVTWQYKGNGMYRNYMLYGTISGSVHENIPQNLIYDSLGKLMLFQVSSKIIVLDFWNSHCGPCYAQFPIIDSINKKIDTSMYQFIVVNVPLNGEKKEDNYKLLNKYNYSFDKLFAVDRNIMDSFRIQYFPSTVVIQRNAIIYRGDFFGALKFINFNN